MNLKFEISDEEIGKLDELMKDVGIDSYRDLFNISLTVFQWAVQQVKEQKVVASVDELAQKYTEIQLDSLTYVSESIKSKQLKDRQEKELREELTNQSTQSVSA